jgi:uncharacterized protein (TIGR02118 family)
MKLVLTVGFDGEAGDFADQILRETSRLIEALGAARGAVDLPATGEEADVAAEIEAPIASDLSAVLSFWEPSAPLQTSDLMIRGEGRLTGAYRVDEVVQLDYQRTWTQGTVSPGIKQLVFIKRRPELSHGEYSDHWRNTHGPLALAHHGFWRYVQDHVTERLTGTTPELDGIAELHFREARDMIDRMYLSEEGMRLILDDVRSFVSLPDLTMLVTKEHLIP